MIEIELQDPARVFTLKGYHVVDHGRVKLWPDQARQNEQVTFVTKSGRECDFAATTWGFYLGPSLNSRLKQQGFRTALVRNEAGQIYVMAVEQDKLQQFEQYLADSSAAIVFWFDEWERANGKEPVK